MNVKSVSIWDATDPEDDPEPPADVEFWSYFGWATIRDDEDHNMDRVPASIDTEFPCPKCGSAWVELRALGFGAPLATHGRIIRVDPPLIALETFPVTEIRAVRIVCFHGHTVDYDSLTGMKRVLPIPKWSSAALIGVGAIAAVVVGASALFLRKGR